MALGPELVQNGTFDDDSVWDWDTGWYWSEELRTAECTEDTGWMAQDIGCVAGKKYLVVFTLIEPFGGPAVRFWVGSAAGTYRSAAGTYAEVVTCTGDTELLGFQKTGEIAWISIDNVSVKEITGVTQGFAG